MAGASNPFWICEGGEEPKEMVADYIRRVIISKAHGRESNIYLGRVEGSRRGHSKTVVQFELFPRGRAVHKSQWGRREKNGITAVRVPICANTSLAVTLSGRELADLCTDADFHRREGSLLVALFGIHLAFEVDGGRTCVRYIPHEQGAPSYILDTYVGAGEDGEDISPGPPSPK